MCSAPILDAYSLPGDRLRWVVPCCFCCRLHIHAAEAGHRTPHCSGRTGPADGYTLALAGPATPDILRRLRQQGWSFGRGGRG